MLALTVDLKVWFPVPFYPLVFGLLFDLLSKLVMVGSLSFCLGLLKGDLPSSVFSYRLCFKIIHLMLLHLLILLKLKLLQKHVLHGLVLLLPSLLILILRLEKWLPTIIPFFNQVLKLLLSLLVVINKDAAALPLNRRGLKSVGVQVLKGKTGMQGRNWSVPIEICISFPLNRSLLNVIVSIFLLLLELHGLLQLIIINSLECVPVVLAGIVINLDLLNDSRIDLLPQLLAMMLLIGIVHSIDLLHAVFYFRRMW